MIGPFRKPVLIEPLKGSTTVFHKRTVSAHSPWSPYYRTWEVWDKLTTNNNCVKLDDKTTLWECFDDGKVVWINGRELRWPTHGIPPQ